MLPSPYEVNFSQRKDAVASETFVQRWSPRSFDASPLAQEELEQIFDAVRFSPSSFNAQPWRIFSCKADRSDFERFLKLLVERNQTWAHNASALGFIIAEKNFAHNSRENHWSQFDCGFAWAALTFQANQLGLYSHGMAGINSEAVYQEFAIDPEKYHVIIGFAIGKLTLPDQLPDSFKAREQPSARKPLSEIYFPGGGQLQ